MTDIVHEPINRNLNTLVCKHCSFQWSFVDRKAWSENCIKRMEQTIKALQERNAELENMVEELTDSLNRTLQYAREIAGRRDVHSTEEVLDDLQRERDRALSELAEIKKKYEIR